MTNALPLVQIVLRESQRRFHYHDFEYSLRKSTKDGTVSNDTKVYIPSEVVEMHLLEDVSLIKAWRNYRPISCMDMANKLNMTVSQLGHLEAKNGQVDTETLNDIANFFGVSIEHLID